MEERKDWNFIQSFGDDNSSADDLVTAVEFDATGRHIAVGDKAGRICLFEGHQEDKNSKFEFKFYTEFQSHEPEFDCLKSLELEEKINAIKFWGHGQNEALFILATNDKTIKLWKVAEKKLKRVNTVHKPTSGLHVSKLSHHQTVTHATPKRSFSNAHNYHINSIAPNCDGETFISVDDLRVNLWNINVSDTCFNVVDVKPPNLEELTELIISAHLHPTSCNILVYANSRGSVRLCDMRDSALCDQHAKVFEVQEDPSTKSFFSEIISSISDVTFTQGGRYILSRDYFTLKLWDVNMESKPVMEVPVHDYLKLYLTDLYKNDCIFDEFECATSPDGTQLVTGSYDNYFVHHDTITNKSVTVQALLDSPTTVSSSAEEPFEPDVREMDFGKKALHVAWHPYEDVLAIAGLNKLYIYQA